MSESQLPAGRREVFSPAGMSNADGEIDEGFEEALVAGDTYGHHAAWDFNGIVWFDAETGLFYEEVWQYRVRQKLHQASTLAELMDQVNAEWGWR